MRSIDLTEAAAEGQTPSCVSLTLQLEKSDITFTSPPCHDLPYLGGAAAWTIVQLALAPLGLMQTALHVAFWGQLGILTRIYLDQLFQVHGVLSSPLAPPPPPPPSLTYTLYTVVLALSSMLKQQKTNLTVRPDRTVAPGDGAFASPRPEPRAARWAPISRTCRQTCLAPLSWACWRHRRRCTCRAERHAGCVPVEHLPRFKAC